MLTVVRDFIFSSVTLNFIISTTLSKAKGTQAYVSYVPQTGLLYSRTLIHSRASSGHLEYSKRH